MTYKVPHVGCEHCGEPFIGAKYQRFCTPGCSAKGRRPPSPRRYLKKWTDADLARAYERIRTGVTVKQIAVEFEVNQSGLGRLLKRRFGYQPTPFRRPTLNIPEDVAIRAYIAGLIDGEGSIPFLNNHWCVKVAMTDEPVIRWLHGFGGHFDIQNQRQVKLDGSPKKTVFAWNVHRRHDVIHLFASILPYLIVKRERAQEVLAEIQI